ncbi:MAG: site-specific integrase [Ignavibacteriota bacterium]
MFQDMQLRNLTPETQRNYVHHVAGFARYFDKSPEVLDLEAVRQYQLYLLNERKLSPESINQYISAIKFLYLVTLKCPGPTSTSRVSAAPTNSRLCSARKKCSPSSIMCLASSIARP